MARIVLRPLQTFGHRCHQIINTIKAIKTARHALSTGPWCAPCWYDAADFTVKNTSWHGYLRWEHPITRVWLCYVTGERDLKRLRGSQQKEFSMYASRSRKNLGFLREGEGSERTIRFWPSNGKIRKIGAPKFMRGYKDRVTDNATIFTWKTHARLRANFCFFCAVHKKNYRNKIIAR